MGAEGEENDSTWVPLTPEVTKKSKNVHNKSGNKKAPGSKKPKAMEKDPTWLPKTPKVTTAEKSNGSDDEDVSNKRPRKKTKIHRPKVFDSRPVKPKTPSKPKTPPKTESKSRKPRTPKTDKESKCSVKTSSNAKSQTPKAAGNSVDESIPISGRRRSCKRKLDYCTDANDDSTDQNVASTSLANGVYDSMVLSSTYVKFEKGRRMVRRRISLGKLSRLTEIIHNILLCPCKCNLSLSWMHLRRNRYNHRRLGNEFIIPANNEPELELELAREHTPDDENMVDLGSEEDGVRNVKVESMEPKLLQTDSCYIGIGDVKVDVLESMEPKLQTDFSCDGVGDVKLDHSQSFDKKLSTETDTLSFHRSVQSFRPSESRSVFSIKDAADGEIYADFLSQKMAASLYITDKYQKKTDKSNQLILFNQKEEGLKKNNGKRKLKVHDSKELILLKQKKKDAKAYKIDLDDITLKIWDIGVQNNGGEGSKEEDDDREYWEKERDECSRKLASVMDCIHPFLGHRPFSRWKCSVVDSIVGVFLTQNVSDSLSSSAFMSLVERYPAPVHKESLESFQVEYSSQIKISQVDECQQEENSQVDLGQVLESQDETIGDKTLTELSQVNSTSSRVNSTSELIFVARNPPQESNIRVELSQDGESQQDEFGDLSQVIESQQDESGDKILIELSQVSSTPEFICTPSEGTKKTKKGKSKVKNASAELNWDELRKKYGKSENREDRCADSVDWEAVRRASVDEFAAAIEQRGMSNQLAEKIKSFLDRLIKDHGSMDLEWLRDVPTNEAKDYLLSIYGLGLKSADCVMLLSLYERAFPVDVNIGRVLVRLGIVPLKPLPDGLLFHNLDSYPLLDDIEKYLWPRICNLDVPKLYALHCYLNAFSKAFCTKLSPNCNACPLKGDCKHYASVQISSRIAIEDSRSREKNVFTKSSAKLKMVADACEEHRTSQNFEPIIEFPASPEHVPDHVPELLEEADIEDYGSDILLNDKVISTIVKHSRSILEDSGDSKALIALKPRIASIPPPKLKHSERLRTVHQVFEIPDNHPLLAGFENREIDDPNPYLLAIWLPDQNEDSKRRCSCPQSSSSWGVGSCCSRGIVQYQHVETVEGTILIPSRTAVRGSFPLNGTYFQFNEVFADHESSVIPIVVPTKCLGSLTKRILYCGTTITSICKGMSLEEIGFNFSRCFICIRGFDMKTRGPRRLSKRFHRSTIKPISKEQ